MSMLAKIFKRLSTRGIRTKLILIILGVTILSTLGSLFFIHASLTSAMGEQLDQKGLSTTRSLTARSREPILTDNIFKLYQLAYDTVETYEDVIYVFYEDQEGNVVIHTFEDYFPQDLLTVEHSFTGENHSMEKFRTEEGLLRDIAAPVFDGPEREIIIRVGLLDYSIQSAMAATTRQLLLVATATFIGASILAYLLATQTTIKPLNSLLESVWAVTKGNLSEQVEVSSRDELKTLAEAFNTMTVRLSETRQARDMLMKQIINSQEEERQRIARELHDETGQQITTLMINLHFLENSNSMEEFNQKAGEFRELLTQTLQQVRLMSWKLSPTPLANLGLEEALQSFIKKYEESADWNIELNTRGLQEVTLSTETQINLYRAIQEALTNIARHAHAENVKIEFTAENEILLIEIEDDGVGFDVAKLTRQQNARGSMGLNTMKERVALIGGKLDIDSTPGEGTRITIRINLSGQGGEKNE